MFSYQDFKDLEDPHFEVDRKDQRSRLAGIVQRKIANYLPNAPQTPTDPVVYLNNNERKNVYITSDLHGDYLGLIKYLLNTGTVSIDSKLISQDNKTGYDLSAVKNGILDDYKHTTFGMWTIKYVFEELIEKMAWEKAGTVLFILGDIIDPVRGKKNNDYDPHYCELLVHIILFNLRILATAKKIKTCFQYGKS